MVRARRGDGDARHVCPGTAELLVHPRVRRGVCARLGLRFSPGRLALRRRGSDLVRRGAAPLVDGADWRQDLRQRSSRDWSSLSVRRRDWGQCERTLHAYVWASCFGKRTTVCSGWRLATPERPPFLTSPFPSSKRPSYRLPTGPATTTERPTRGRAAPPGARRRPPRGPR